MMAESRVPAGGTPEVPLAPPDRQPPDLELPQVRRKAGWAVMGLGVLAAEEILPAFGQAQRSRPVALVSGHADKARKLAEAYGIDETAVYGYEDGAALARNDAIDIVYVVLPNSLHAEHTVKALEAGKHVLCEKPMAVTSAECQRMIDAARAAGRKLMIAYRLHYEPFNMKVMELCRQGAIGRLKTFVSSNGQNTEAPNIRLSRDLGGGPVSDTGIYSINAARYVIGEEPVTVTATAHRPADDPRFREVPESVSYTLRYPSGVLAHCDTSFGVGVSRFFRVHGTEGFIDLHEAFAYRGQRLRLRRGSQREETLLLQPVNHFAAEMDHFSAALLDGGPVRTPGELGLADVRIIEAIDEAIRTGGPVEVAR
jgi:predicted dehydrogenase